jgi:hypothetical protein
VPRVTGSLRSPLLLPRVLRLTVISALNPVMRFPSGVCNGDYMNRLIENATTTKKGNRRRKKRLLLSM